MAQKVTDPSIVFASRKEQARTPPAAPTLKRSIDAQGQPFLPNAKEIYSNRLAMASPVHETASAPAPGAALPAAGDDGIAYTHVQGEPSGCWHVVHMLVRKPSVQFLDTEGREITPDSVMVTAYQAQAFFKTPVAGKALCTLKDYS